MDLRSSGLDKTLIKMAEGFRRHRADEGISRPDIDKDRPPPPPPRDPSLALIAGGSIAAIALALIAGIIAVSLATKVISYLMVPGETLPTRQQAPPAHVLATQRPLFEELPKVQHRRHTSWTFTQADVGRFYVIEHLRDRLCIFAKGERRAEWLPVPQEAPEIVFVDEHGRDRPRGDPTHGYALYYRVAYPVTIQYFTVPAEEFCYP
jgi:hypothetical protein